MAWFPPGERRTTDAIGAAISEEMEDRQTRVAVLAASIPPLPKTTVFDHIETNLDQISDTYPLFCDSMAVDTSPAEIFKVGMALFKIRRYSAAHSCFKKVANSDDADESTTRLASEKLAMMYELGWGVEADWEEAKDWYRRAGVTFESMP